MPAPVVKRRSEQRLLHPAGVNESAGSCMAVLVLHRLLTSIHLSSPAGNRPDVMSVLNCSVCFKTVLNYFCLIQ